MEPALESQGVLLAALRGISSASIMHTLVAFTFPYLQI